MSESSVLLEKVLIELGKVISDTLMSMSDRLIDEMLDKSVDTKLS
jgi:hypothetical protein